MDPFRFASPASFDQSYWNIGDFPPSILDQHFGEVLTDLDFCPKKSVNNRDVSLRTTLAIQSSGESAVRNEKDKFVVTLDVKDFEAGELDVKVIDKFLIIHGKHEDKADKHGFIQREFTRGYILPPGAEADTVTTSLSTKGILTIVAPKKVIESLSREIVVSVINPTTNTCTTDNDTVVKPVCNVDNELKECGQ